jgi:hypothetical protein
MACVLVLVLVFVVDGLLADAATVFIKLLFRCCNRVGSKLQKRPRCFGRLPFTVVRLPILIKIVGTRSGQFVH